MNFHFVENFIGDSLINLPIFPNLYVISFGTCNNIEIRKNNFATFRKLRILSFWNSTIRLLEQGSLENLPSLKTIIFDWDVDPSFSSQQRQYIFRFHCSPQYEWLRELLSDRPRLISPVQECEIYKFPAENRDGLQIRQICNNQYSKLYYRFDCSQNSLTGKATGYSTNPFWVCDAGLFYGRESSRLCSLMLNSTLMPFGS